ncbi:MAG TPA: transposase [Tepidisphaeraceae bacterium]|nr:transposase [Tepidisphaeraceae bacterium]
MRCSGCIKRRARPPQRQVVDFTPGRPHRTEGSKFKKGTPTSRFVRRLGREDQVVEWARPRRPAWMSEAQFALMPQGVMVRELRYRVVVKGRRTRVVTVVTTLLDPMRHPKQEIARLYGLRWEVETNFRHLKATMKMEQLKCQTPDGVMKELMVFVLVYNLIRAAMAAAGERQGVDPGRISFVDTTRWLRAYCTPPCRKGPVDLIVNPQRGGRWNPRVLKHRLKPYDLMNKPRDQYAQPVEEQDVAA